MPYIDVHVWTPDIAHYPLARGYKRENMQPRSFTPDELFKHTRRAKVDRINLIQMSYYCFDNTYMLDMITLYRDVFVGTAIVNPLGPRPDRICCWSAHLKAGALRRYANGRVSLAAQHKQSGLH